MREASQRFRIWEVRSCSPSNWKFTERKTSTNKYLAARRRCPQVTKHQIQSNSSAFCTPAHAWTGKFNCSTGRSPGSARPTYRSRPAAVGHRSCRCRNAARGLLGLRTYMPVCMAHARKRKWPAAAVRCKTARRPQWKVKRTVGGCGRRRPLLTHGRRGCRGMQAYLRLPSVIRYSRGTVMPSSVR